MFRKFGPALLIIGCLITAGTASAATLFYTDEPSWLAALPSDATIGGYPHPALTTTTVTTIETTSAGCCTVLGQTITSVPGAGPVVGNFSFLSPCEFSPGCVITATTDITVTFSVPILGFASDLSLLGGDIELIGTGLPGVVGYDGFYGVVGLLSSLDFTILSSADQFTDNQRLYRPDIYRLCDRR